MAGRIGGLRGIRSGSRAPVASSSSWPSLGGAGKGLRRERVVLSSRKRAGEESVPIDGAYEDIKSIRAQVEVVGSKGIATAFRGMTSWMTTERRSRLLGVFVEASCDVHGPDTTVELLRSALNDPAGEVKPGPRVFSLLFQCVIDRGVEVKWATKIRQFMNRYEVQPDDICAENAVLALANANDVDGALEELRRAQKQTPIYEIGVLNAVIAAAASKGRVTDAEAVMNFISDRFLRPTAGTFNALLKAYGRSGNVQKANDVMATMKKSGFEPSIQTFNALMDAYVNQGDETGVKSVLERIERSNFGPDTITYNTMLSASIKSRNASSTEAIYHRMLRFQVKPDLNTLKLLIRAKFLGGDISSVRPLIEQFQELHHLRMDSDIYDGLVLEFCKAGAIEEAEDARVMSKLERKPISSAAVEALACAQAERNRPQDAMKTLRELMATENTIEAGPSESTFVTVASAFQRIDVIDNTVKLISIGRKRGFSSDSFLSLSMVALAKSGDIPGALESAERLRRGRSLSVDELAFLLKLLCRRDDVQTASVYGRDLRGRLSRLAQAGRSKPSLAVETALNELLTLQASKDNLGEALETQKLLATCELKESEQSKVALTKLRARRGELGLARSLLEKLTVADADACHTVLGAHAAVGDITGCKAVITVLTRMGLRWETRTYATMIRAHGNQKDERGAEIVFERLLRDGRLKKANIMDDEADSHNALLFAYANCGNERQTLLQLDRMRRNGVIPNTEAYGSIVEMYASRNVVSRANRILHQMRNDGVAPNSETIRSLVKAYKSSKDLRGARFAVLELRRLQLAADTATYNEIIELLAEFGDVNTIKAVIRDMKAVNQNPNTTSYVQLILACGKAKDKRTLATLWESVPKTTATRAAHINALVDSGDTRSAIRELAELEPRLRLQATTLNAALKAYAVEGRLNDAVRMLGELVRLEEKVDPEAYSLFFDALTAAQGGTDRASDFLREKGLSVDEKSFVHVVSAQLNQPLIPQRNSPVRKPMERVALSTNVENSLLAHYRAENTSKVVQLFRTLPSGIMKLGTEAIKTVIESVAVCGTAEDVCSVQMALARSAQNLGDGVVDRLVDKVATDGSAEDLVGTLSCVHLSKATLNSETAKKALNVLIRANQMSAAFTLVKNLRLSGTIDSKSLNSMYRIVVVSQIDAGDIRGAEKTLAGLAERWDVDLEFQTLQPVLNSYAANGDARKIRTLLKWMPYQNQEETIAMHSDIIKNCALQGNLHAAIALVKHLRQYSMEPQGSALHALCDALERNGEILAAHRLIASMQKRQPQ